MMNSMFNVCSDAGVFRVMSNRKSFVEVIVSICEPRSFDNCFNLIDICSFILRTMFLKLFIEDWLLLRFSSFFTSTIGFFKIGHSL